MMDLILAYATGVLTGFFALLMAIERPWRKRKTDLPNLPSYRDSLGWYGTRLPKDHDWLDEEGE